MDNGDHEELLEAIFSEQERLKSADSFNIYTIQNRAKLRIAYDSMKVIDCSILNDRDTESPEELIRSVRNILEELKGMGYVFAHSVSEDGAVSLTCREDA